MSSHTSRPRAEALNWQDFRGSSKAALALIERLMKSERVEYRMTGNKKRRVSVNIKVIRAKLGTTV
jgi:hypothetical protein